MPKESVHIPVLLSESREFLRASEGGSFLDCTLGGAGHTQALLDASSEVTVAAFDRDPKALARAEAFLTEYGDRVEVAQAAFSELAQRCQGRTFRGMLADLGVSTDQIREERGFAFQDSSLDMRMDPTSGVSARVLLNGATEQELYVIFKKGGVGNEARKVAREIVAQRPIESADQLAKLVVRCGGAKDKKTHPATVVFQALRIAVNHEFEEIDALMQAAPSLVEKGGRLVVISFHSLEDKAVTRVMREWDSGGSAPANYPGAVRHERKGRLLTKKAVFPTEQEIERNPSARSARMRVFEFL